MKKPTGPVTYTVWKGAGSGAELVAVIAIIAALLATWWVFV